MKEIGRFIVNHWELISGALLALISLIIQLFKKKPAANSVLDYIMKIVAEDLPDYICQAEKKFDAGEDKLLYVVSLAIGKLKTYVTLDDDSKWKARNVFVACIESILSTPEKKD